MTSLISYATAYASFQSEIVPLIVARYGADDAVAHSEEWNNYTDSLTRDGEFNALMYHYCPADDDTMPDASDVGEFLLDSMGVAMTSEKLTTRTDGSTWSESATHWRVTLTRGDKAFSCEYSMGSAYTTEPRITDVLENLFSDSEAGDYDSFEEWADALGYDADSRKAEATYKACQVNAEGIRSMFTESERSDLAEVFGDLY